MTSSLKSFQEKVLLYQSGFNLETTQNTHVGGTCMPGLESQVMDMQMGGSRTTQRLAMTGGGAGRHHSRLGPEGRVGVMGVQGTRGACSVGARTLEETEMLWGYLVRQEGGEGTRSGLSPPRALQTTPPPSVG